MELNCPANYECVFRPQFPPQDFVHIWLVVGGIIIALIIVSYLVWGRK